MLLQRGAGNGKMKNKNKKPNLKYSPYSNFNSHSLFCYKFVIFPFSWSAAQQFLGSSRNATPQ